MELPWPAHCTYWLVEQASAVVRVRRLGDLTRTIGMSTTKNNILQWTALAASRYAETSRKHVVLTPCAVCISGRPLRGTTRFVTFHLQLLGELCTIVLSVCLVRMPEVQQVTRCIA